MRTPSSSTLPPKSNFGFCVTIEHAKYMAAAFNEAGISARGRTVSEEGIDIDDYEDYLVTWPLEVGEKK